MKDKYVVVFGGARDHYQVAVALEEGGRLEALVSEFYLPAAPAWMRRLAAWLDRSGKSGGRVHTGLPPDRVIISWRAFGAHLLRRKFSSLHFVRWRDGALGRKAGRIAARQGRPLLAYSYYASYAYEQVPASTRKITFQVHPHPQSIRRILLEELRLTPIAAQSLSGEFELGFPPAAIDRLSRDATGADFVITPSTFAKNTLLEVGVPADRIAVVPYGIDHEAFSPKLLAAGAGDRPLRLIFVGSMIQRKGLSYLFEAMRRLRGENVELVLVGRGARDDGLIRSYADVGARLKWDASRQELVEELSQADVFVLPSLAESFAHVILESMAIGLPVITTTHTAGPDLLEEGRTGFCGRIRDVDFLVDRIRWFIANREAIPVMGRACQVAARTRSWDQFRQGIRAALLQAEQKGAR